MKETKMKFKLLGISVDEKSLDWTVKIKSLDVVEVVKSSYMMTIVIDESYFQEKIDEINEHIEEIEKEPDLFDNAEKEIKASKKAISDVESCREELRKKETGEFGAEVKVVDFDKDLLTLTIPEENLLQVVAIRKDIDAFIVNLK